jgi:type II secretory pathway predicted ATPase ExeA
MTESALNVQPGGIPFDLACAPFADSGDDAFFFPSDQHLRALEFLGHTLWTRARLGVVTADHGCGKSLLIRRLLRDLDDRFVFAAVSREQIAPREFLIEVLCQFGLTLEDNDRTDLRRLLERFLHHQASLGRVCVLVVENPQSMQPLVLEELRCLAATEVEGVRVLKVLMLGQPSLNHVLESPRMAELMATHVPKFSLGPLSEDQTAAYVAHRLRAAGARDPDALMPHTLMPQIYSRTGGVPAQINALCTRALQRADEEVAPMVTTTALDRAVMELGLPERGLPEAMRVLARHYQQLSETQDARVIVEMQGLPAQEIHLAGNRILIGRGDEADVRIDSVFVSRYHALIVRTGAEDLLLDLGSTNGLLVNSSRIVRRVLKHSDLIQVGPAKVTYLNPLAVQAADPDPAETICFARPGFPQAAGEEESGGTIISFGRVDSSSGT